MDFEWHMIDRDSSASIYGAIHSETEDIFYGLVRRSDFEFSKKRPLLLQRSLETKIRDLLSGGVNLAIIITMNFLVKDFLGMLDFGHIFSDTGSNQVVLEPTIGSFDLAFGLRREGMDDLDIALLQHLFPLGSRLIGLKVVLIPERVSSPDKAKDRVGIDIISERKSMS